MALDAQDKQWIEQILNQHLGAVEERLQAQTAQLEQRLQAQTTELEQRFQTKVSELEQRLQAQTAELEQRLQANTADLLDRRLHETETKLLGAFFGYQEHWEVRFRKVSADVSNINSTSELRLNNLEQRVIQLEKRFLTGEMPPPPPQ